MKPKQYIEKFKLNDTPYFNRDSFCEDLMDDFKTMLGSVRLSVVTFENCVSQLNVKFWNIFNGSKVQREAAEKFWKFIFAAHIVPVRSLYFPDWKKAIHDHRYANDPDFARRYDTWKMHKEYEDRFRSEFEENFERRRASAESFWEFLRGGFRRFLESIDIPSQVEIQKAKGIFGFHEQETPTKDQIKIKYRTMAKMTHPDLGNDSDAFLALADAKKVLFKAYAYEES